MDFFNEDEVYVLLERVFRLFLFEILGEFFGWIEDEEVDGDYYFIKLLRKFNGIRLMSFVGLVFLLFLIGGFVKLLMGGGYKKYVLDVGLIKLVSFE